jgi:hypothetical protein
MIGAERPSLTFTVVESTVRPTPNDRKHKATVSAILSILLVVWFCILAAASIWSSCLAAHISRAGRTAEVITYLANFSFPSVAKHYGHPEIRSVKVRRWTDWSGSISTAGCPSAGQPLWCPAGTPISTWYLWACWCLVSSKPDVPILTAGSAWRI